MFAICLGLIRVTSTSFCVSTSITVTLSPLFGSTIPVSPSSSVWMSNEPGEEVFFDIVSSEKGPKAENVQRMQAS